MPSCKYIVNFSIADWQTEGLAQTAKTMSELSTEVENILTSFRDEFEMVKNETEKMTSSIEETLRLIQLTLEKVMQTDENVEKCTLIIYLAAHIYIVAVLRPLFISHILVFLVPIIQHIVPKIYTLGAKCSFYGVKYMMAVKKRESIKYFPFQNLIYRLLN